MPANNPPSATPPQPASPSLFATEHDFSVDVPPSPFATVGNARPAGVERARPDRPARSDHPIRRTTSSRPTPHGSPADAPPSRGRDAAATRRVQAPPPGQTLNLRQTLRRLERLARLDQTVFAELVPDSSQTLAAVLVAAVAFGLAAFGGWLWLIADTQGLSASRIAVREFLLGGILLAAAWLGWVALVRGALTRITAQPVDFHTLLRPMAFATLPLALQIFMVLPELAYGIGLITLVAWFGLSVAATEAALPAATRKQALVANGAGFAAVAVFMSLLGSVAAIAPGAFAHGADLSHLV